MNDTDKEFDEFMVEKLGKELYSDLKETDPTRILDWYFQWSRNDYLNLIFCVLATIEEHVTGRGVESNNTAWAQMPKQGQIF